MAPLLLLLHAMINTATCESHSPLLTVHTCIVLPPQYGLTALMLATLKGHSETVSVLVQHGADLNVQNMVQENTLLALFYPYVLWCTLLHVIINTTVSLTLLYSLYIHVTCTYSR